MLQKAMFVFEQDMCGGRCSKRFPVDSPIIVQAATVTSFAATTPAPAATECAIQMKATHSGRNKNSPIKTVSNRQKKWHRTKEII